MLRFKDDIIPKYTKKEYRIIEEKERVKSFMNDAYEKINNLVYKLREEYPAIYKYEKTVFFHELKNSYQISGMDFLEFSKYLLILTNNNLPESELSTIFYNKKEYKVPNREVSKVKDLCEKLDKLFAETDYKIDDLSKLTQENINEDL